MSKKPDSRTTRTPERASKASLERPLTPNTQTILAMEEARKGFLPKFNTVEALMDDLNSDDDQEKLARLRKEIDKGFMAPTRLYTNEDVSDLFDRINALLDGIDYEDLDLDQELPEDEDDEP